MTVGVHQSQPSFASLPLAAAGLRRAQGLTLMFDSNIAISFLLAAGSAGSKNT
eukprot:m.75605 g.75605  ORF g.75605 m.75605 type:complete len:53 (+) comp14407_c0_seq11:1892-2050(+)